MTKSMNNIPGTGTETLTLNEIARIAKDKERSMKKFSTLLSSYVNTTYTPKLLKGVHSMLFLEQTNSKALLDAAYQVLEGVHELDAKAVSTLDLRLLGVKAVTEDKEKRQLIWTVIHQRLRVEAFALIFDGTNHDKKQQRLSSRIKDMMKFLLQKKLELKGKKDHLVAQAIKDGMAKIMLSEMDIDALGDEVTSTIMMIVIYALAETTLVSVRVGRDDKTGAITHNVSINLNMPDSLVNQLKLVAKRGTLLAKIPEVEEGRTYKLVSKRSWRDYKDFPLSKDMADMVNIRNRMTLSLTMEDFVARFKHGMEAKFDTPMENWVDKNAWMQAAFNDAINEAEEIFKMGNKFHIEHFFDRVCRVYEKSEYFGMGQVHALRDLIELSDKLHLNEAGKREIKLNIAAIGGFDKCEEDEMLQGYADNSQMWRSEEWGLALDADGNQPFKEKYTYMKRQFKLLRSKKAEGVLLEYDATNSGPQMYAIGTRSVGLGAITGLFTGPMRLDAYKLLASILNRELETDRFTRSNCKGIFMTSLYNAGKQLILWGKGGETDEHGNEYLTRLAAKNGKMEPLMLTVPNLDPEEVYDAYKRAMREIAPDAMKMMATINGLLDKRLVYEWIMPDGAFCQTAMTTREDRTIEWHDGKNKRHSMTYGYKYLKSEAKGAALAPGIIQSIDAYILRMVKRKAYSEGINVVTLHDAYFVHPNNGARIRAIYREVMAQAMEDDILTFIYNQLAGRPVKTVQFGDMTKEDVLTGLYSLWF